MDKTTVVVVGAGLSGLVAARELVSAGVDVVVAEAADRVGGRTLAETSVLGSRLDLGGTWIGHDHHRVTELAAELGATVFPMHTGALPLVTDGARRTTPLVRAGLPAGAALALLALAARREPRATWQDLTVASWLGRVPGRSARRLLEVLTQVSWTTDPDRLSARTMVDLISRQGGLRTMLSTRGGAQDSLVVEGIGTLAERIADELGERVRLAHRVTRIVRAPEGITLETEGGALRAARVIVTVPPPVAARIVHDPPLPPRRVALEQGTYLGTVHKAIAVYERPFWRERRGGELLLLGRPGGAVFDTSPPGGPGHLTLLFGGAEARALDALEVGLRRTRILDALEPHLGSEVRRYAGWHEKSWHLDEYAAGGYVVLPAPGATDGRYDLASEPVDGIHWAGAETAVDHPGYLDGAIESGRRAARTVLAELGGG